MSTLLPLQQARLVLASASPRRAMLLAQLGLSPVVDPSGVDESAAAGLSPGLLVETLSRQKAEDVAARHPGADLVLGADTVVVKSDVVLGKPENGPAAAEMLRMLSDSWHEVLTGFTLIAPRGDRRVSAHVVSSVRFRALEDAEVAAYIATGEPFDKAGSYAIQGLAGLFVTEIRGDYTNIVGLPLPALDAAWRDLGWKVL